MHQWWHNAKHDAIFVIILKYLLAKNNFWRLILNNLLFRLQKHKILFIYKKVHTHTIRSIPIVIGTTSIWIVSIIKSLKKINYRLSLFKNTFLNKRDIIKLYTIFKRLDKQTDKFLLSFAQSRSTFSIRAWDSNCCKYCTDKFD